MVPSLNQSLSNDETAVVQPPPSYEIDPPTSDEDGTSTVRGPRGFPGLSAYEVWVQNGGQGSPATYLASLVGPRGKSTALFVKDFIRDLSDPLSVAEGFNIAFGTAQASAVAEVVAAPGIYGMMLNVANLPGQIRLTIMEGAYLQTTRRVAFSKRSTPPTSASTTKVSSTRRVRPCRRSLSKPRPMGRSTSPS